MLSYQHSYHAGSNADVHKHAVLSVILTALTQKDKPLVYLETHAGRGLYDLASEASQKTGEATQGILKLLTSKKIPLQHPYLKALHLVHSEYGKNYYPGSPLVAKYLLRESDHLHLMELHPQEYLALKKLKSANFHVYNRDGYEGVLAISPPKIRRGLVLIDPSYEVKSEYTATAEFVLKLHHKWPQAVILVWYPLLEANYHLKLCSILKNKKLPKFWQQQCVFPNSIEKGMRGSGLICVNLPFGTEQALRECSSFL